MPRQFGSQNFVTLRTQFGRHLVPTPCTQPCSMNKNESAHSLLLNAISTAEEEYARKSRGFATHPQVCNLLRGARGFRGIETGAGCVSLRGMRLGPVAKLPNRREGAQSHPGQMVFHM